MTRARTTVVAAGLTAALLIAAPAGLEAKTTTAKVAKVGDGDSVSLVVGSRTRKVDLAGIDAPELKGDAATSCFGKEAAARLRKLLPRGAKVKLRGAGELLRGRTSINRALVKGGFARARAGGGRLGAQLRSDEAAAKAKALGLWKACGAPTPQGAPPSAPPPSQPAPAPADVTGQAAIDRMTSELKDMLFRQFHSGSSSTESWQMNFCADTRFRYYHEYSYSSNGFFGNTRDEILGKPWTVTEAVIHVNGDRSATVHVNPTSRADSSGPQSTPPPEDVKFENTAGSWYWSGTIAEGQAGQAACDPLLQHS